MAGYADGEHDRARRFRDAALPYLDDVFTLARYLMRNAADAEDAVQECLPPSVASFRYLSRPDHEAAAAGPIEYICTAVRGCRRRSSRRSQAFRIRPLRRCTYSTLGNSARYQCQGRNRVKQKEALYQSLFPSLKGQPELF
jgi:hypothetical protein